MIGIVVSDKFLIAGVWSDDENGGLTLHNVKQINYNDPISGFVHKEGCLLYTSPSPRDQRGSRMPSSA